MPKNVKENISESGISDMLCVIATAMLNATGVWTDTVVDEKLSESVFELGDSFSTQ